MSLPLAPLQLVDAVDHFCTSRPDADGCDVDKRSLGLTLAFRAFASGERLDTTLLFSFLPRPTDEVVGAAV